MKYSLVKALQNHKDFYGKGHYHKQIYHGAQLIWEKAKRLVTGLFVQLSISSYKRLLCISEIDSEKKLLAIFPRTTTLYLNRLSYSISLDGTIATSYNMPSSPENVGCFFIDDKTILFISDTWSTEHYTYEYRFDTTGVVNATKKEKFKNNSYDVYSLPNLTYRGCVLKNGLMFVGVERIGASSNANWIDENGLLHDFRCPYINIDTDFEGAYAVKSNTSYMTQYVYSNFVTNETKNRLFGMKHQIYSVDGTEVTDYTFSIVEFNYPELASTEIDSLITKNVLFSTHEICNVTGLSEPTNRSAYCVDMFSANNSIFFVSHILNQPYQLYCINADTSECTVVLEVEYTQAMQLVGAHYYNGTYYVFYCRTSNVTMAVSKNLEEWQHIELDIVSDSVSTLLYGGCIYVSNYAAIYKISL